MAKYPKPIPEHQRRIADELVRARANENISVLLDPNDVESLLADAQRLLRPVLTPPVSIDSPLWEVITHHEVLRLGDHVHGMRTTELHLHAQGVGHFYVHVVVRASDGSELPWGPAYVTGKDLTEGRVNAIAWARNIIDSVARDLNLAATRPEDV